MYRKRIIVYHYFIKNIWETIMENNWTIAQTKELFDAVKEAAEQKRGLVWAFNKIAKSCGRSANSVRNYYYSQLKMFELVPGLAKDLGITLITSQRDDFELFGEEEIKTLVETILLGKAQGRSVRAVIAEMSNGDAKLALRYQNKYRSMVTHHRDRVTAIMNDMSSRGLVFYNPYLKSVSAASKGNLELLTEYVSKLDEGEVGKFLSLITKLM